MADNPLPDVGEWYITEEGDRFEIVAVDGDDQTIEIQYFGGEVEEVDFETWDQMGMESIATPEDWSGPFDDLEADDMGDTEEPAHPDDHNDPLDQVE